MGSVDLGIFIYLSRDVLFAKSYISMLTSRQYLFAYLYKGRLLPFMSFSETYPLGKSSLTGIYEGEASNHQLVL